MLKRNLCTPLFNLLHYVGECQFAENVLGVLRTRENYTLPAQWLLKMAKTIL